MPTITPDVVLLLAADKLVDAIGGIIPKTTVTEDAITQLMAIFCDKAMASSDAHVSAKGAPQNCHNKEDASRRNACRITKGGERSR